MADYVPGSFMNTPGYNSGQVRTPSPRSVPYWDADGKMHYPPVPMSPARYGSFMNTPGYNMGHAQSALGKFNIVLPCTPDLPSGFVGNPNGKSLNLGTTDGDGGGGGGSTKTATTSIFTDTFFLASPNYEVEILLSFKSLTGNEILQVAHRQNFYTTNAVLNSNILDIVDSINFYSPTQIIKLQNPDLSYFQNNVGAYRLSLTSSVVTISIPSAGIDQSFKIEVETFAPNSIKNDTIYT